MKTIRTRKLLSAVDPVPIQLRVSVGGIIDISVPGTDLLPLSATDPSPFAIQYISFSSWGTTEAKFFYDCRLDDQKQEQNILEELTPELTANDKIRMFLFNQYDQHVVPADLENIYVNLEMLKVLYDYKKSFLTTHAILRAVITFGSIEILRMFVGNKFKYKYLPNIFYRTGPIRKWFGIHKTLAEFMDLN